jgi:cytochrome c-type biogenesis protein CcmH
MKRFLLNFSRVVFLLGGVYGLSISQAMAISPEEVMADPQLEQRARNISKQLRCLVCSNQSIDDSEADLARDLRREVRLQLNKGMSDADIFNHLQDRFGDHILLKPPINPATYALWATPIILLMLGGGFFILSRRKTASIISPPAAIDDDLGDDDLGSTPYPPMIWGGAFIIAASSIGLYLLLGRPDLEMHPLAERQAEIARAQDADSKRDALHHQNLAKTRAEAAANPSSVQAQLAFAMAAAQAGDSEAEQSGLAHALTLTDRHPTILALMAEAISRASGGMVTLPARKLIAESLVKHPDERRARYLKGLAAFQDENYSEAIIIWVELAKIIPADDALADVLDENIAAAADLGGLPIPPAIN